MCPFPENYVPPRVTNKLTLKIASNKTDGKKMGQPNIVHVNDSRRRPMSIISMYTETGCLDFLLASRRPKSE